MKTLRFGATLVEVIGGEAWCLMVTPPFAAVCNRHGAPHLYPRPERSHPDHRPAIPLGSELTLEMALECLRALCLERPAGPSLEDLRRVLS